MGLNILYYLLAIAAYSLEPSNHAHAKDSIIYSALNSKGFPAGPDKYLENYPEIVLNRVGDINIGALFELYEPTLSYKLICGSMLDEYLISKVFALIYGIESLNANLMPTYNISLGYYILPTCTNPTLALMQAVNLIKIGEMSPLLAVVGPFSSPEANLVANYLSYNKVTELSPGANANFLKDNRYFSYLFRMATDQNNYINALVKIVAKMGWKYYSIINNNNKYLTYYRNQVYLRLNQNGACLAKNIRIDDSFTEERGLVEYGKQFKELIAESNKTRLLFLFLPKFQYVLVLKTLEKLGGQSKFVLVALDNWPDIREIVEEKLTSIALNTIMIFEDNRQVKDFGEWMNWNKREGTQLYSDWLSLNSMINGSENTSPDNLSDKANYDKRLSIILDTMSTLDLALNGLIKNKCAPVASSKSKLIGCINRHSIYNYLFNVSFHGRTGAISFNPKDRSIIKLIKFSQLRAMPLVNHAAPGQAKVTVANMDLKFFYETVATFNPSKNYLTIIKPLVWNNHTFKKSSEAPLSHCSRPCKLGEHLIPTDKACCWVCIRCKPWEIFDTNSNTRCTICPRFTWPSADNTCVHLPIYYIYQTFGGVYYIFVILIVANILYFLALAIFYGLHHKSRVFRLVHEPLMCILFCGLGLGSLSLITYLIPFPGNNVCQATQFLLLASIVIVFASMIGQLHGIRQALKPSTPKLVNNNKSKNTQLYFIVIGLITFQLILNVTYILLNMLRPFKSHVIPVSEVQTFSNYVYKYKIEKSNVRNDMNAASGYVEMSCAIYPKTAQYFFTQIIFHIILILLTFFNTVSIQDVPFEFKEVKAITINSYINMGLFLTAMLLYIFLDSTLGILVYLIAIYLLFFVTLVLQSYFKLRSIYQDAVRVRRLQNSDVVTNTLRDTKN